MKIKAFVPVLATMLCVAVDAGAVSLTLQGNGGASLQMQDAQAVYASDSNGVSTLITGEGMPAPDKGTITEVGVPSMMPDGRVIFGAEMQPKDSNLKPKWNIYIGDADNVPSHRLMAALNPKAIVGNCIPAFKGDPYPVADADGNIAFTSTVPHGRDTLFLYSHGTLTCIAKAGMKTNEGHEIAVLSFGSPQIGDHLQIAFNAFLTIDDKSAGESKQPEAHKPSNDYAPDGGSKERDDNTDPPVVHRQALLMVSPTAGITELAVEGEYGPNHTLYQRPFGLPAALQSPQGTIVAFTAKSPVGAALYLYSGGTMARILPSGTVTPLGPVTYLSPGRPGLMADGTTAVLAACARTPAVFRLSRQRLEVRIQRGQLTPFGTELESLGDPVLTASGAMFIGATDTDDHERLYVLSGDDEFFEVGEPELIYRIAMSTRKRHSIFTGTLTVNQHGDFGYLGGK